MSTAREEARQDLIKIIKNMGYPEEFGQVLADSLGTEKQIARMTAWLIAFKPNRTEDIVDEMLAIKAEFERYRDKKIAEYCNSKYNEILNYGIADNHFVK